MAHNKSIKKITKELELGNFDEFVYAIRLPVGEDGKRQYAIGAKGILVDLLLALHEIHGGLLAEGRKEKMLAGAAKREPHRVPPVQGLRQETGGGVGAVTDAELIKAVAFALDWNHAGYENDWDTGKEIVFGFNPLTDANHRDMVVEAMIEKGWWYEGSSFPGLHIAQFHKRLRASGPKQDAKTKGRAVCLAAEAALKAMEGE